MKNIGINLVWLVVVMMYVMPASSFAAACSGAGTDTDGDGIDDIFEDPDTSGDCDDDDTDRDGISNYLDVDDDGDGILTILETDVDTDGDRTPDYLDHDSDNDTILDAVDLDRLVIHILTADANGPYSVAGGSGLILDGSGSFTSDGLPIATYEWDVGNDGVFDFSSPVEILALSSADISFLLFPGIYEINLRVTDEAGFVDTDSTTLIASISPVPLPAAFWLFGTALFGLVGFGKRRKAA